MGLELIPREEILRILAERDSARSEVEKLRDVLQRLMDVQNGVPLPKYEMQWKKVVSEAALLLLRA